jgi:hypothetical protein
MATVMFKIRKWPSRDRLLDALKYGRDPKIKFRVDFTIDKSGCNPIKLEDVRVSGYDEGIDNPDWVELTLVVPRDVNYHGHLYLPGPFKAWVSVAARNIPGHMALTQR